MKADETSSRKDWFWKDCRLCSADFTDDSTEESCQCLTLFLGKNKECVLIVGCVL